MSIVLTAIEKGGEHTIVHDLNFQTPHYDAKHTIVRGLKSTYFPQPLKCADFQEP